MIENQGSRTYFEQYCGHLPPDPDSENFQTTGFANELADTLGAVQQALRGIAPVTAIRGNVDTGDWGREFPETAHIRLAERSILVLHDLKILGVDPVAAAIDVIVSGHSHVPKIDEVEGVLYLNPGSAGRRRFKLPITLAILEITPHALTPIIHDLVDW